MVDRTAVSATDARARLLDLARAWHVTIERIVVTRAALVGFGVRQRDHVVVKVVSFPHDEWNGGAVAAAFCGSGVVRVHEHVPGAVLLEQARPGTPLTEVVRAGRDDEATNILARVVESMMAVSPSTAGHVTAEHWGAGFRRYLASGDQRIPTGLVEEARERYIELCGTQTQVRLLHGDLQHYNILLDVDRGWVAIDPKGVVAEVEFELAAGLRNPHGVPELYTTFAIERRVGRLVDALAIDRDRVIAWAFALAVLSAIWTIEDDGDFERDDPAVQVAEAAQALLR